MTHQQIRDRYLSYFKNLNHQIIPSAPLVLTEDATTLFTSSGMQPLVPYLLGQLHPEGKRLVDIQPCIRTSDIDEVGDTSHLTFFEMLGNWSLGDYFKTEQLSWVWDFYTKELGLPKEKLFVTVFEGDKYVSRDIESESIWKKIGINSDHLFCYGTDKNWWSRSGTPEKMPEGEIGGPDSEMFYDFGENLELHQQSEYKNDTCHPNCRCGRFVEIGNSVFIQYQKKNGKLIEMKQKNVDFGGGLERVALALNNDPDIYKTDLFSTIINEIEKLTNKKYKDDQKTFRIIADHLKAAMMIITNGIEPSNKAQGYVVRRLLRKSALKLYQWQGGIIKDLTPVIDRILTSYNIEDHQIISIINKEMIRFGDTLERGLKYFNKLDINQLEGEAFNLFSTYGYPYELTFELAKEKGIEINMDTFNEMYKSHRKLSQKVAAGFFKGGLADHSDQVIKYHTATHLLHQALRDVLGTSVRQEGSNITGERLRFDFGYSDKISDGQLRQVEEIINHKIKDKIPVSFKIMLKSEAEKVGAHSFFREKYPDQVKVYYVGKSLDEAYSKEFCGGPHVSNTGEINSIKIFKLKKIGFNLYRVYAR